VLAATALAARAASGKARHLKHELVEGVAEVARRLGNTLAIRRKCYIHPAVIVAHAENALLAVLERSVRSIHQI
jgi:DNA topoisomerase-1